MEGNCNDLGAAGARVFARCQSLPKFDFSFATLFTIVDAGKVGFEWALTSSICSNRSAEPHRPGIPSRRAHPIERKFADVNTGQQICSLTSTGRFVPGGSIIRTDRGDQVGRGLRWGIS
jgi:hypothetical protein